MRNLLATGAGQNQKLEYVPEWAVVGGAPYLHQLIVGQHTVSTVGSDRTLQAIHRADRDDFPAHRPLKEPVQMGVNAASFSRGATIDDAVEQLDHVALRDRIDQAPVPYRQHVAIDGAAGLVQGRGLGVALVSLKPVLDDAGYGVAGLGCAGQGPAP